MRPSHLCEIGCLLVLMLLASCQLLAQEAPPASPPPAVSAPVAGGPSVPTSPPAQPVIPEMASPAGLQEAGRDNFLLLGAMLLTGLTSPNRGQPPLGSGPEALNADLMGPDFVRRGSLTSVQPAPITAAQLAAIRTRQALAGLDLTLTRRSAGDFLLLQMPVLASPPLNP